MKIQYKISLALAALAVAFASGRYSVPKQAAIISKTDTKTVADTEKEVRTKTVIVKEPSGETTTTITQEADTQQQVVQDKKQDLVVTPPKISTLNVSVLGAVDPLNNFRPLYGLSVSKQFIGPFTAGAFGLSNGTLGISVGLNF